MHCCPSCSIAWRAGAGGAAGGPATTGSSAGLACPDCGDRNLVPMGATAQGEAWRCLACHGRLVRVANSAGPSPTSERVIDGTAAESGGPVADFLVEALMVALEGIAGV